MIKAKLTCTSCLCEDYYGVLIVEERHIYVSGNDSLKSYSIVYLKRRLHGRANGVFMGAYGNESPVAP